jgi:hypothetical protein
MPQGHRPIRAVALATAILVLAACDASAGPSATAPVTAAAPTPTAAPSTAAAATPAPTTPATAGATQIHLVKDCSTFTTLIPSYCEISASDFAAIPVGAKVNYLGPLLDDPNFLSSNVLIDDAHGSTATGYCIFDARPTESRGFCAFSSGTGALAGFVALFKVSIDALGEWHLDGESYGSSPAPQPS